MLQLDHCDDINYYKTCADAGYTSIMMDTSKQDFKENIRQTKEVSHYYHRIGNISVAVELGTVSGVEDQVRVAEDEAALCDPEQVLDCSPVPRRMIIGGRKQYMVDG